MSTSRRMSTSLVCQLRSLLNKALARLKRSFSISTSDVSATVKIKGMVTAKVLIIKTQEIVYYQQYSTIKLSFYDFPYAHGSDLFVFTFCYCYPA